MERHSGTSDAFRRMSPSRRSCLYPDETHYHADRRPSSFFPRYSESNCVLECSWRRAADRCRCLPWYLFHSALVSSAAGAALCELHGNACFQEVVESRHRVGGDACSDKCLPDCERTDYSLEDSHVG